MRGHSIINYVFTEKLSSNYPQYPLLSGVLILSPYQRGHALFMVHFKFHNILFNAEY